MTAPVRSWAQPLRMSKELRRRLENVAIKCSIMDPHQAADDLEGILGGRIDDERQIVVYPGDEDEPDAMDKGKQPQ